jgi:hypothetical protein
MKKALLKLTFLAIALLSLAYVSNNNAAAAPTTCINNITDYFNHFGQCDSQYQTTSSAYYSALSSCPGQAASTCGGTVQPCYDTQYASCMATPQYNYDQRGFSYSNCAYSETICQYEMTDFCSTAASQAYTCAMLYQTYDSTAYGACMSASGYYTCV